MDTLARADAFFLITAIAVMVVGAALLVVLVYAALILRDLKRASSRLRAETDLIADDLDTLRRDLRRGSVFQAVGRFVRGVFAGPARAPRAKGG